MQRRKVDCPFHFEAIATFGGSFEYTFGVGPNVVFPHTSSGTLSCKIIDVLAEITYRQYAFHLSERLDIYLCYREKQLTWVLLECSSSQRVLTLPSKVTSYTLGYPWVPLRLNTKIHRIGFY